MKIAILWNQWSGYMDACAKALQSLTGCSLDIVYFEKDPQAPYDTGGFFQYSCNVLTLDEVGRRILTDPYDLLLICSWDTPIYRKFAASATGRSIRVLCMDNQWRRTPRQFLGIAAFRLCLRNLFDFAFVAGPRQAVFAHHLGFQVSRIIEGHYSCDESAFRWNPCHSHSNSSFLFAGRLVEEKGIDVLAGAWARFCEEHQSSPWRLTIAGTGPQLAVLRGLPRLDLLGFVQPAELPAVMRKAAALVLPSRFEPWGIVVHEAATSGLPLIVSNRCGATDYFLCPGLNGYLISPDSIDALLDALNKFVKLSPSDRLSMAQRSCLLARRRSPTTWAASVAQVLTQAYQVRVQNVENAGRLKVLN
jgi:glycosyltransferase involved in cell wall biosynthesis